MLYRCVSAVQKGKGGGGRGAWDRFAACLVVYEHIQRTYFVVLSTSTDRCSSSRCAVQTLKPIPPRTAVENGWFLAEKCVAAVFHMSDHRPTSLPQQICERQLTANTQVTDSNSVFHFQVTRRCACWGVQSKSFRVPRPAPRCSINVSSATLQNHPTKLSV